MDVFIVEDDDNIKELVAYVLSSNGFNVTTFSDGDELFCSLKSNTPVIIILDIMLPKINGIEILKRLKSNNATQNIPIIMLSAKNFEYDKVKSLDYGADDYITKPFSVLEFVARVKTVLRRTQKQNIHNIFKFKNLELNQNKRAVTIDSVEIPLTYKEFELLSLLIENRGIVLTRDKILEKVWGFDFEGESRTVDMHIKTLRKKLNVLGSSILTVRGVGYKLTD